MFLYYGTFIRCSHFVKKSCKNSSICENYNSLILSLFLHPTWYIFVHFSKESYNFVKSQNVIFQNNFLNFVLGSSKIWSIIYGFFAVKPQFTAHWNCLSCIYCQFRQYYVSLGPYFTNLDMPVIKCACFNWNCWCFE